MERHCYNGGARTSRGQLLYKEWQILIYNGPYVWSRHKIRTKISAFFLLYAFNIAEVIEDYAGLTFDSRDEEELEDILSGVKRGIHLHLLKKIINYEKVFILFSANF